MTRNSHGQFISLILSLPIKTKYASSNAYTAPRHPLRTTATTASKSSCMFSKICNSSRKIKKHSYKNQKAPRSTILEVVYSPSHTPPRYTAENPLPCNTKLLHTHLWSTPPESGALLRRQIFKKSLSPPVKCFRNQIKCTSFNSNHHPRIRPDVLISCPHLSALFRAQSFSITSPPPIHCLALVLEALLQRVLHQLDENSCNSGSSLH